MVTEFPNEDESIVKDSNMLDDELERLCVPSGRFDSGVAPWVCWESESSSFGIAFRSYSHYPQWLPLYLISDHAVHWESRCWENEVTAAPKLFFSWNKKKAKAMGERYGKNSYHVPHPWIAYQRKLACNDLGKQGTLVFFPHSNDVSKPQISDLDAYMNSLLELPEKYQPVSICLSFHDIKKGLHKDLRRYGIPIVTAGLVNSKKFAERFYGLIKKSKYATSPNIGSHTFYCVQAGVPFFLTGERPVFMLKGSEMVKDGQQDLKDYGDDEDILAYEHMHTLFSQRVDSPTAEQIDLVNRYMGADAQISPATMSLLLWWSLLVNWESLIRLYAKTSIRYCKKFLARCIE